MIFVVF